MTVKRPILVDLADFGIHINNSEFKCCRCKGSVRGWTEGIFADELCRSCVDVRVKGVELSRRESVFYRPRTVYAMHPSTYLSRMRVIWNGVSLPQRSDSYFTCVVKIDSVLYVGRNRGGYVSLHNKAGAEVRKFGLQITQEHLAKIYARQSNG